MTERTQIILFFTVATFFLVVFIAVVLVKHYGSTKAGIDGVRNRIDGLDQATGLEHEKMAEKLKRVDGRTQFLVATTIADELSAAQAMKDNPNPPGDTTP